MQPVAHGEVSQLSLQGLREFDLDQKRAEYDAPGRNHYDHCRFRFGSKADIQAPSSDVRFIPKSGHD